MVAAVHQGFLSRLRTTQQGVIEWDSDGVSNYVICEQLRDQTQQAASRPALSTSSPSDIALHDLVLKLMGSSQPAETSAQQVSAVAERCTHVDAGSDLNKAWLILDADDLQKTRPQQQQEQEQQLQTMPQPDQCLHETIQPSPPCQLSTTPPPSLFENLALSLPGQVLALVQNIYFLPFGPSGTTPSTPGLVQAWASLAGIMAVSEFVAKYLQRWGNCTWQDQVPDLSCCAGSESPQAFLADNSSFDDTSAVQTPHRDPSTLATTQRTNNMLRPAVNVIHLCAWGVFGGPTFPDFGARVTRTMSQATVSQTSSLSAQEKAAGARTTPQLETLQLECEASNNCSSVSNEGNPYMQSLSGFKLSSSSDIGGGGPGGGSARPRPVIGMMKMMPEKGSSIVLELARRLPEYDFLAVTGEV